MAGWLVCRCHLSIVEAFDEATRRAFDLAMMATRDQALIMSSGELTEADLRQMDHPYARRHPDPLLNPAIINDHTGEFKEHWKQPEVMNVGDDLAGRIINDSAVADYLRDGTEAMHDRPIEPELEAFAGTHLEFELSLSLREFERTTFHY